MTSGRLSGLSFGARVLARVEASDRARRRIVSFDRGAFELDYGPFGADAGGFDKRDPGDLDPTRIDVSGRSPGLEDDSREVDDTADDIDAANPNVYAPYGGTFDDFAAVSDVRVTPSGRAPAAHVRTYGAYNGPYVTNEGQYPDRFGQQPVAFGADGLPADSRNQRKSVADVKQLVDVIVYRMKVLQPAVYAVPDTTRDYGPVRADFMRLQGRVMNALKLAQDTILACARRVSLKECDAPAERAYDALVSAVRQGGKVNSPVRRGDFDDIVRRVQAAGVRVDLSDAPEFGYEASFGDNIAGVKSIADLKDLLANWDARMAALGNSFAAFSPQWVQIDPGAMADWSNDWAALQDRYGKARATAQDAIDGASSTLRSIMSLGASNLIGDQAAAQDEYLGILKAIKQSTTDVYGGGTVSKGDYDDLAPRLQKAQKAAGAAQASIPTVQPVATDPGLAVYNALQPLDVIGATTGQFHSPLLNWIGAQIGVNPNPPPPGAKTQAFIVGMAVIFGGIFTVKLFIAPTVKAAIGLGVAIVGGYAGYKSVDAVVSEAKKLGTGAKLLGL